MKSIFLLAGLLLAPLVAGAQQARIDSLRRVIETTKVDTVRGRTHCRLCRVLLSAGQAEAARKNLDVGLALSQQNGDRKGVLICRFTAGIWLLNQNELHKALDAFKATLAESQKQSDVLLTLDSYVYLGSLYLSLGHPDSAKATFDQGLRLSQRTGNLTSKARCLHGLANLYQMTTQFKDALAAMEEALALYQQAGARRETASILNNLANLKFNMGHHLEAVRLHQTSLKIRDELGDREGIASTKGNIGGMLVMIKNYEQGLLELESARQIWVELKNDLRAATMQANIASVHFYLKRHELALRQFQELLPVFERFGAAAELTNCLVNIGACLVELRQARSALPYFHRAHSLYDQMHVQDDLAICKVNLGGAYLALQRLDSAQHYIEAGYRMARHVGRIEYLEQASSKRHELLAVLGHWQAAYAELKLHKTYADSLKNDEKSRELGRIESQAHYEKQVEIERLKNDAERQRQSERYGWMLGSAGGGLLLMLIIAFTLFRGRRKEQQANAALRTLNEEIQQQKAEIEAQNSEITAQRDQLNTTNQRLVELDRMKEQLTGMIVHDLKNPLNVILGFAALPPDAQRLVSIRRAGQQMSQLVLNLLDVQKYEEAALVLTVEWAAAAELIRQAVAQTEFLAQQKQIDFAIDADPRLSVEADGELIVRVLVNLLTNAIKYAPAGDRIEIEAQWDDTQGAIFRVTDHGRGIPADQLEQVFEKFGQVGGGQASGQLRSTGLGLTFCRLTVEAHGGRIGVQSEVGQYTAFEFSLPKAKLDDTAASIQLKPASQPDPALPADVQALIADSLNRLRLLPAYDLTTILDELAALPDQPDPLSSWKTALEEAALSGNEARYRQLLNAG